MRAEGRGCREEFDSGPRTGKERLLAWRYQRQIPLEGEGARVVSEAGRNGREEVVREGESARARAKDGTKAVRPSSVKRIGCCPEFVQRCGCMFIRQGKGRGKGKAFGFVESGGAGAGSVASVGHEGSCPSRFCMLVVTA